MAEMIIRRATYDDALAIATIHMHTWQVAYRGQIPDSFLDSMSLDERFGRWQRILETQADPTRTFVAEGAGQLAGFATVGKSRDEDASDTAGELYAIYVAPQVMSQGVGSALMGKGRAHLVESGFTHAILWVLESNQRARRFYESKGWAADGVTRVEEIGGAMIPEVRYAILLISQCNSQSKS